MMRSLLFSLFFSLAAHAAPVATVELLEAGAGTELNYWIARIKGAGFEVSVQGAAQNRRVITQIFYAQGFEAQARQLAAALHLPAEAIQLRTWNSPWNLTVAASAVPRSPEDETARAELKALEGPVTDEWLLGALRRGIHSVEHREKLRKELRSRRELSPALIQALLERFPDLLIEKSPATVLPPLGARLALVKSTEVAERQALARLAGSYVAREPAQLNQAQKALGDDRKLQIVMLTNAVRVLTSRDDDGGPAATPVLLAWLAAIKSPADVRLTREEFHCQDVECLDASSFAGPRYAARPIWAMNPASLSSEASEGLAMLLSRDEELLDWSRAVPRTPAVNWGPWLLEQIRAKRLELAPLVTMLDAWKVDLFALRNAPPEPLTPETDALLVKSGCERLKKSTDDAQRAKAASMLLSNPSTRAWSSISYCAYDDSQHSDVWVTALTANVEQYPTEIFLEVLNSWESELTRSSPPVRAALMAALHRAAAKSPQAGERQIYLAVFEYTLAGYPRDRLVAFMKELPTSPPLRRLLLRRLSVTLRRRIGSFGYLDKEKKALIVAELSAALEVARAGLKPADAETAAELELLEEEVTNHVPFIYSM